MKFDDIEDDYH